MRIIVNGTNIEWNKGTDLIKLLDSMDEYEEGEYCVIINGRIIPNADKYVEVKLKDGDSINVISMLIGG